MYVPETICLDLISHQIKPQSHIIVRLGHPVWSFGGELLRLWRSPLASLVHDNSLFLSNQLETEDAIHDADADAVVFARMLTIAISPAIAVCIATAETFAEVVVVTTLV